MEQIIKSGDESKNLQIGNLSVGISYSEAREIALDVFNANFVKLTQEASDLATERAEKFSEKLIENFQKHASGFLNVVKDPGFQFALFEAQRNYAKTGDEAMKDTLIDVLIDRAQQTERNLRQITIDDSLAIIPKLLSSQLDILTIVFLLKRSHNNGVNSFDTLKKYLEVYIKPFVGHLTKEDSIYGHLESTGCGRVGLMESSIESILKGNYRGLFFQGFDKELFEDSIGSSDEYKDLIAVCLNNEKKFQLDAINQEALLKKLSEKCVTEEVAQKLKSLFEQYVMSDKLVKDKLLELGGDFIKKLFDVWDDSSLKHMSLTPLGIVIAQANFRRKTGISLDLSIWIK